MKISKLAYSVLAGILMLSIVPVFGEVSKNEQPAVKESVPSCSVHAAFTDPAVMAATMADPVKFNEFMIAVNNPATAQALMNCSMDPKQWTAWAVNFSDPGKWMAAMTPFMNPQMYANWMAAAMNPQTYQFMYAYMNPAFYSQWMAAAMNPQFYQPMYKMADPKWQQETAAWMMDPSVYTNMFSSFYPPVVADASTPATTE